MTPTRREFGAFVMAGVGATAIPSTPLAGAAEARAAAEEVPWGGPLAPDQPLAKAYDDAARALADVDDNPMIRWQYRVWCQTGYRSPGSAGTGQPVDQLVDPATDFVSPKGSSTGTMSGPCPRVGSSSWTTPGTSAPTSPGSCSSGVWGCGAASAGAVQCR
ncbi:hypothetical protein ACFYO0_09635 [Streptomyces sp. NPDC006365]|uniref:hypothetical protein n=1 Tax=Streptomyces sp. NPDC006365 TaxID=3364744 RepID=UPI0036B07D34